MTTSILFIYLFIFQQIFGLIFCLSGTFTELKQTGNRQPGCLVSSTFSILRDNTYYIFGGKAQDIGAESGPFKYNLESQSWHLTFPRRFADARYEHSAIIKDGTLVIFGGRYDNRYINKIFNSLWTYNENPAEWQLVNNNGPFLHGHTAFYDKKINSMIVFGGCEGDAKFYNDLWKYSFDNNTWTKIEVSGQRPAPRCAHSAVTHTDKEVIIFGGYGPGDKYYNDMWKLHYDENNNFHWENVEYKSTERPSPRYAQSSTLYENNILVFGGWDPQKTLNDFWAYDIINSKWSQVSIDGKVPERRAGHATALSQNGDILFFGGYNSESPTRNFLCDLFVFRIKK